MENDLKTIQKKLKKISRLEKQVKDLQGTNKKWRNNYYNALSKIDTLESRMVNISELEQLELENGKLRAELNTMKRNKRADEKLQKIIEILNGG